MALIYYYNQISLSEDKEGGREFVSVGQLMVLINMDKND